MNTIFKYPLQVTNEQRIDVPSRGRAIAVQVQDGKICVWYAVQSEYATVNRRIFIFGTGQEVPAGLLLAYIGTVQLDGYVWHVFQEVE